MLCKVCQKNHATSNHYKVMDKLEEKGYPTSYAKYPSAHREANKVEKRTYPDGYKEMKKVDAELPKNELAGKNLKNGKIEVSKKVPPKLRKEVALHEKTESKILRNKGKK